MSGVGLGIRVGVGVGVEVGVAGAWVVVAMGVAGVGAALVDVDAGVARVSGSPTQVSRLRELCGFGDDLPHRTTFNCFIQRLSHHADLVETALVLQRLFARKGP